MFGLLQAEPSSAGVSCFGRVNGLAWFHGFNMIPIDVLSLTANIIQVVDFGIRVTKQLKEQYRAADGMVKENRESLQVSTGRLSKTNGRIP